jgi:hypothetical protein
MVEDDGACRGLGDNGGNGIRVVGHGEVSAPGQHLDAGAWRALAQLLQLDA